MHIVAQIYLLRIHPAQQKNDIGNKLSGALEYWSVGEQSVQQFMSITPSLQYSSQKMLY
jgi:hypothetical protein